MIMQLGAGKRWLQQGQKQWVLSLPSKISFTYFANVTLLFKVKFVWNYEIVKMLQSIPLITDVTCLFPSHEKIFIIQYFWRCVAASEVTGVVSEDVMKQKIYWHTVFRFLNNRHVQFVKECLPRRRHCSLWRVYMADLWPSAINNTAGRWIIKGGTCSNGVSAMEDKEAVMDNFLTPWILIRYRLLILPMDSFISKNTNFLDFM